MRFTVRVKEGYEETLKLITKLCEDSNTSYHMKEYSMMICVEINTSSDSKLSAYVSEEHYLDGNYGLHIFNRDVYEKSLFIPLSNLDEIYSL